MPDPTHLLWCDREPGPIDVAWAGGLFEGEGSFSLNTNRNRSKTRTYHYPRATVSSCDEEVVRRFHWAISGVGSVNGPYTVKRANHSPYWVWTATRTSEVEHVLQLLSPWLSERRRQRGAEVVSNRTDIGAGTVPALEIRGA